MWPVMHDLGLGGLHAGALFASGLQLGEEPGIARVRPAITTAIRAFGRSGCAGRVAQEFGDHPDTAVSRLRWARDTAAPWLRSPDGYMMAHGLGARSRGEAVERARAFGLLGSSPRSG